jgi:predicted MPP superfamily phosphohydrolase
MDLVLLFLALIGHCFLWIGYANRIHATSLSRGLMINLTFAGLGLTILIPIVFGVTLIRLGFTPLEPVPWSALPFVETAYLVACWCAVAVTGLFWIWGRITHRPVDVLRFHRSRVTKLSRRNAVAGSPDDHVHHFLAHLPGNQILQIDCAERGIEVARLDPCLEGLSIIHLSDLHLTGRIGKAYFQEVAHLCNEQEPDLILITGDLLDSGACVEWIPDVFGVLRAKHGVFYILGNHDRRVGPARVREHLNALGLVSVGGRWLVHEVNGVPILLAGNELPWLPPAADLTGAPPSPDEGGPLRILLSHSPDQLHWASNHDFDLMLAGHLHGGQFRLPLIGPILSPSRTGVRFASGVFHDPPTVLHVSRGISAEVPIRFNCPPEMTKLILHGKPNPDG